MTYHMNQPAMNVVLDGTYAARSAVCRHRFGSEMRRLRKSASLRLGDVAATLGVAPSTLSRIESGLAPARNSYVCAMLDMYGVTDPDCRRQLTAMASEGRRKGWWTDYDDVLPAGTGTYLTGLEAAASSIQSFAALAVPDLVQTYAYAEALCGAASPPVTACRAERLVAVTRRRQELARGNPVRRLHLIVDESALLRPIGSAEIMARQLHRLAVMTADPSRTIQVVPLRQPCSILTPSFTVLTFTELGAADIACRGDIHCAVSIIKRDRDVAALARTFAALAQAAMPPEDSAGLIRRLASAERNCW